MKHHRPFVVADTTTGTLVPPESVQGSVILRLQEAERRTSVAAILAGTRLLAVKYVAVVVGGVARDRLAPVAIGRIDVNAIAPPGMKNLVIEHAVAQRARSHLNQTRIEQRELREGKPRAEEILHDRERVERIGADQRLIALQITGRRTEENARIPLHALTGLRIVGPRVVQCQSAIAGVGGLRLVVATNQHESVQRVLAVPHQTTRSLTVRSIERGPRDQRQTVNRVHGQAVIGQLSARRLIRIVVRRRIPPTARLEVDAIRADVGGHCEVVNLPWFLTRLHVLNQFASIAKRQRTLLVDPGENHAVDNQ